MIIDSIKSLTPRPVFALIKLCSVQSSPIASSTSAKTRIGSALGRSILLTTGRSSKSLSIAIYTFAIVCASTPWVESTISKAPSDDAKERLTS